jgi:hypothetical protein
MSNSVLTAIFWGGIASAALLVGFYLAERGLSNRTIGIVIGFGAGSLRTCRYAGGHHARNGFFNHCDIGIHAVRF